MTTYRRASRPTKEQRLAYYNNLPMIKEMRAKVDTLMASGQTEAAKKVEAEIQMWISEMDKEYRLGMMG